MKKTTRNLIILTAVLSLSLIGCSKTAAPKETAAPASANPAASAPSTTQQTMGIGAQGALEDTQLTQEKMLKYAIEDEYLARGKYDAVLKKYGEIKPFSNIIKAEEKHIQFLKNIYAKYNYTLPEDKSAELIRLPDNVNDMLKAGVQAEIANIDMYDKFLQQQLPDDIKLVFTELRDASKNHLNAFQRNAK